MTWIPLVFLGGGLGSVARHACAVAIDTLRRQSPPPANAFPWATLAVNIAGCVAIGLVAHAAIQRPVVRLAVVTGLLGGFTTFSSFGLETARLLAAGQTGKAGAYVVITNTIGLTAAFIAYRATATHADTLAAIEPD